MAAKVLPSGEKKLVHHHPLKQIYNLAEFHGRVVKIVDFYKA